MVEFLIQQCQDLYLFLNFTTHSLFFLMLTYIVFYRETFCKTHSTIIWYTGLSSLFVSISILIQWIFGINHPMSYDNIKVLSDTIFFINLSLLFFIIIKHKNIIKKELEKISSSI